MRRAPQPRRQAKVPTLSPDEVAFVRSVLIAQDNRVMALAKPSGLSSQGGRGQVNTLDEMLFAFERHGQRPVLIHRLDRDTSGVIVAAKTRAAAGFLGKAIQARQVQKTYLALLAAPPDPFEGEIAVALRREEIGRETFMRTCADDHPDAEAAFTRYRTLAAAPSAALVELKPVTGRMHQLRAHLASIGRPILGDVRYGGALVAAGQAVPRLMLHSLEYGFPHPEGGFAAARAAPSDDFARLAHALGLTDLPTEPSGLFRIDPVQLETA